MPTAVEIDGDGRHRLAHADDGVVGLTSDAIGRAVARAGLVGGQGGIGMQVYGGPQDPAGVVVEDDRAVHLGQLAQARRREVDVEREPAAREGFDGAVEPEDHECTGASAEDALESIAQGRPRRDHGEHVAEPHLTVGSHRPPCRWLVSLVR